MLTKHNIEQLLILLNQQWPDARSELEYTNPYTLLVSVVLSAQATDKSVNKATIDLYKKVTNPQQMLDLGEEKLKNYIKSIGLSNSKAKNIIALSRRLIDLYQGQVPGTREDLESLPGVGQKTASVVLNIVFNNPTIAVDTHIFRLSKRTGLASAHTPNKVEVQLNECIPDQYKLSCHYVLILHGRYICKAIKPLCHKCCIKHICQYSEKNLEH